MQTIIIIFNIYKIFKISAETYTKNCVYNIIDKVKSCGYEIKT